MMSWNNRTMLVFLSVICLFCHTRSILSQERIPTTLKAICSTDVAPVIEPNVYKEFTQALISYLSIAKHLPGYPTSCLLSLPQSTEKRTFSDFDRKAAHYANLNPLVSTVLWHYASFLADSRRPDQRKLDAQFLTSLSKTYLSDPKRRQCLLTEYTFAKQYVKYLNGSADPDKALAAFSQFKSIRLSEAPCGFAIFGGDIPPPPLFAEANAWARQLDYDELLKESTADHSKLTALYLELMTAGDRQEVARFIQNRMLASPLLVPAGLSSRQSAPPLLKTNLHLSGQLTAGDAPVQNIDIDLGAVVRDHKENNDWYNRDYGEVYSQSDIWIKNAETFDIGPDLSYQVSLQSFVQGGYDPPWPGRTIHTRGAHDYTSRVDFDATATVNIPECKGSDSSCFPTGRVVAALSSDDSNVGITNSLLLTQNANSLVGTYLQNGGVEFSIDRSQGPTVVQLHLTRHFPHQGACCAPRWQEQIGQVFVNIDGTPDLHKPNGKGYDQAVNLWLRHYDPMFPLETNIADELGPSLTYYPLPRWATSSDPAWIRANDRYDIYLRLFWAEKILDFDLSLSVADKLAVEKSRRILSGLVRDLYRAETRRQLDDYMTLAGLVNTENLDLALGSLLEALPRTTAIAVDKLASFERNNISTLSPDQKETLRSVIELTPDTLSRDRALTLEAAMKIIQIRYSTIHLRNILREQMVGQVIELARLDDDCSAVLSRYSSILKTDITRTRLFSCQVVAKDEEK